MKRLHRISENMYANVACQTTDILRIHTLWGSHGSCYWYSYAFVVAFWANGAFAVVSSCPTALLFADHLWFTMKTLNKQVHVPYNIPSSMQSSLSASRQGDRQCRECCTTSASIVSYMFPSSHYERKEQREYQDVFVSIIQLFQIAPFRLLLLRQHSRSKLQSTKRAAVCFVWR